MTRQTRPAPCPHPFSSRPLASRSLRTHLQFLACLAAASGLLPSLGVPQQGWVRAGYDGGNTSRYPTSSSPNAGSLKLLFSDTTLRNAVVLTSDLDGDRVLDIVVSTPSRLLALKGSGSVLWQTSWTTVSKELQYIGDVDGDGRPEILLAYRNPSPTGSFAIDVYDHDGTLNKTLTRTVSPIGGTGVRVQGHVGSTIVVGYDTDFAPRGAGLVDFNTAVFSDYLVGGAFWGSMALGDINADGKMDLALPWGTPTNGNSANGTTDWDLYTVVLTTNSVTAPTLLSPLFSRKLYATATRGFLTGFMPDLNNDGRPELLFLEGHDPIYHTGTQKALFMDTAGNVLRQWSAFANRGHLLATVLDDFNQDGWKELAFSGDEVDGFFIVDGRALTTMASSPSGGRVLGAADVNGDGWTDLVVHERVTGFLRIVDARTMGVISSWHVGAFGPGYAKSATFAISDVTGNGILELLVCGANGFYVLDSGGGWYLPYASGCGRNGGPRLNANLGQVPTRNSPFSMTISNLPIGLPSGSVFVMLSLAEYQPPVSLASIGMTGCNLYTDGTWGLSLLPCTVLPIGIASTSIHVPNFPALRFVTQALALDTSANKLGLVLSNPAIGFTNR